MANQPKTENEAETTALRESDARYGAITNRHLEGRLK